MTQHIVSDLGGVLIHIEWQERVCRLLNRAIPLDELHKLWVNVPSVTAFETGKISFDEFAQEFIRDFDLEIEPVVVKQEFLDIVQAPREQTVSVLQELRDRYTLSLLSNTNPAHYERITTQYDFFQYFDHLFLSYKIGMIKPNPAIFQHVINELKTDPENILFFDDGKGNVEAAANVGIRAFQVTSPEEIWAIALA